ncbi:MAG TPA: biopolymer transporter ExbD [Flavisolibacter sp.]|jgi:biopolymer transport protein ExbD|nr:biopolymer transporter ExbD [Flavisolibacter sp.]
MPSVKIPKKSTVNDMTPFVDIAFLILSFFIMATKMKPPEPVEITTPNSVSTDKLPENDAILVEMDGTGRVFFSMLADANPEAKRYVIQNINSNRNLGLTDAEINSYVKGPSIGIPFSGLKSYLSKSDDQQKAVNQPGIPVKDSASNELYFWVNAAIKGFQGRKVNYLIKSDNNAKYPDFKRVIEAFKRNDVYKFQLVTSPEEAPVGTELFKTRQSSGGTAASN